MPSPFRSKDLLTIESEGPPGLTLGAWVGPCEFLVDSDPPKFTHPSQRLIKQLLSRCLSVLFLVCVCVCALVAQTSCLEPSATFMAQGLRYHREWLSQKQKQMEQLQGRATTCTTPTTQHHKKWERSLDNELRLKVLHLKSKVGHSTP